MQTRASVILATLLLLFSPSLANAAPLKLQFIPNVASAETPSSLDGFGGAIAATETVISIGCPGDKTKGVNAGAVYQFSAVTGKFLRKLYCLQPGAGQRYGASVAVSGNLLAVGAPNFGAGGAMLWYDANSGAIKGAVGDDQTGGLWGTSVAVAGTNIFVGRPGSYGGKGSIMIINTAAAGNYKTLTQNTATEVAGIGFANTVTVAGNLVIVGAPLSNSGAGSAYVFDLNAAYNLPAQLRSFEVAILHSPAPAAGDSFGSAIIATGKSALIGCPGNDTTAANAGAVFLFDLSSMSTPGTALSIAGSTAHPIAPGSVAQDALGTSLSTSGGLILVGSPGRTVSGIAGAGMVTVLNTAGYTTLTSLTAQEPVLNGAFGKSTAVAGSLAAVGGYHLHTDAVVGPPAVPAVERGTVYSFSPLRILLPFTELYRRTSSTVGLAGSNFAAPLMQSIAATDDATLLSSYDGSTKGKGIYRTTATSISPVLRSGSDVPFSAVAPVGYVTDILSALGNSTAHHIGLVQGKGTGITAANDLGFVSIDTATQLPTLQLREGDALDTGKVGTLNTLYQSASRVQFTTKLISGAAVVAAANDTAITTFDPSTSTKTLRREGEALGGAEFLGEITQQHGIDGNNGFFVAGITGGLAAANQGLFSTAGGAPLLRRGGVVVTGDTASFSSFLGISQNAAHYLVKATVNVSGSLATLPVTAANNEVLVANTGVADATRLVARKGVITPGLLTGTTLATSVTIKQFVNYALLSDLSVVAKCVLQGPGVTAANDAALISFPPTGDAVVILREGTAMPGYGGGSLGVISAWSVSPTGHYVALCTLLSAAKGTDQILVDGDTADGSMNVVTRKGMIYDTEGSEVIKSIGITTPPKAAQGIANGAMLNGLSRIISDAGSSIFTLIFNDNREGLYQSN